MVLKNIIQNHASDEKIMISDNKQQMTYKEFHAKVMFLSQMMKADIDVCRRCNNIGLYINNSVYYAIGYFTISFMDKTIVPIPVDFKEIELQKMVEACELDFIITTSDYSDGLLKSLDNLSHEIKIYCLDTNKVQTKEGRQRVCYTAYPIPKSDEEKVAIILQTSGTTNSPKRVMLTHQNILSNVEANAMALGLKEGDISLIALPMYLGYCNTSQFLCHLYVGASIVIMNGLYSPIKMASYVQQYQITTISCVPAMMLSWLSVNSRIQSDLSSLRLISYGGAPMPVEKLKKIMELYPNCEFSQTYGMTEAAPRIAVMPGAQRYKKIGSVGKAINEVEIRIVNEQGENVDIGEVIVKGPNIMLGYYQNEEATKACIKDGWLYTGDIGWLDDDKYLYLIGRRKNIIISGGRNIHPEEIEEILLNHPGVKEVLVYGIEDLLLGEIPCAKVVLEENVSRVDIEKKLVNYCRENLAAYKIPRRIYMVDKIEKTISNKIKRRSKYE